MDAVEDVKARLSIEDVISEYVQLKRAGRNFRGLSPFSNEKTPSFMVSPEKQIWHDFSSGKGGNMFSFVMEVEGLDFRAALELLARKAGLDLSQYQRSSAGSNGKLKQRLVEANELAAKFYQAHFTKNAQTVDYVFKTRHFNKQTALDFRLGYAPESGSALRTFLAKQGFSTDEMQRAGLIAWRGRDSVDMFRGRLMIPLMDPQGQVIGFTARLLKDDPKAPKYLNTPQTILYDKSRHVYGLHLAKEAIRKGKNAVIVEGNLDVIASHQVDVRQVVATAGTAITEYHLKALSRFTQDIRLAFDRDDAGLVATERAIQLAEKAGVVMSIVDTPGAKDPDELIQKDPAAWQKAVDGHTDALNWLINEYQNRADLTTYAGRDQFKQAVLSSLKRLKSRGEQDVYATKLAQILGYSKEAIFDELTLIKQDKTTYKLNQNADTRLDQKRLEVKKAQDHLLSICIKQPALRFHLKSLNDEMLSDDQGRQLMQYFVDNPDVDGVVGDDQQLSNIADYVKILNLQYEELYQDLGLLELRNEAARMQVRLIEEYVKTKKRRLSEALKTATEAEITVLLEQAKELDKLLNSHKGSRL